MSLVTNYFFVPLIYIGAKNHFAHICSSSRRKRKVKNATKHWVCEKVKDFLTNSTFGAKALNKKLKEHHTCNTLNFILEVSSLVP